MMDMVTTTYRSLGRLDKLGVDLGRTHPEFRHPEMVLEKSVDLGNNGLDGSAR